MSTPSEDTLRQKIEERLEAEPIYRGILGRRRLSELLPEGVSLRDVLPRLLHLATTPYSERVGALEAKGKASAAERRVLSRKANETPDVIILEDVGLAEVAEMLKLRAEGVTPAKLATLFELPPQTVKAILDTMAGKHADKVVYSAEMRRRRTLTLKRPVSTGRRLVAVDESSEEVASMSEGEPLRLTHG